MQCNEKSTHRGKHCAGCGKAEPKLFAPPQTPFPGARDGQNLISWRWSLLHLQHQFGEDRCTQFRVIMTTDPHTHTHRQTHRQDRSQYTAPLSLACSVTNSRRRLLLSVIQPTAQRTRGVDPGKVGVLTPDGMV